MRLFLPQREGVRPVGGLRAQRLPWAWWLAKRQRGRRAGDAGPISYTVPAPTAFWRLGEAAGATRADSAGTCDLQDVNYVFASAAGRMGGAAWFDDYYLHALQAYDHAALRPGNASFSFSLWYNGTLTGVQSGVMLSKYYYDGDTQEEGYQLGSASYKPYIFLLLDDYPGIYYLATNGNYAQNQWHHLVITFNRAANRARLYMNGVLDVEHLNLTAPIRFSYADLFLGADNDFYTPFDGLLDGVGWFQGVELTAAHVAELATGIEFFGGQWNLVAPGS